MKFVFALAFMLACSSSFADELDTRKIDWTKSDFVYRGEIGSPILSLEDNATLVLIDKSGYKLKEETKDQWVFERIAK